MNKTFYLKFGERKVAIYLTNDFLPTSVAVVTVTVVKKITAAKKLRRTIVLYQDGRSSVEMIFEEQATNLLKFS